jgi:hypothetical protein
MEGRFFRGDGIAVGWLAAPPNYLVMRCGEPPSYLFCFSLRPANMGVQSSCRACGKTAPAAIRGPAICSNPLRKLEQLKIRYLASDTPSRCSPEYRAQPDFPAVLAFQRRHHLVEHGNMSTLRRPTIWGHRVKNAEVRRNYSPSWAVARKDRDRWSEGCRVAQGAGVDRENLGFANFAAEYEAATNGTRIPHGVGTARGFGYESSRVTAEAHRIAGEPHEWDGTRPRRFAAIRTVTVARVY